MWSPTSTARWQQKSFFQVQTLKRLLIITYLFWRHCLEGFVARMHQFLHQCQQYWRKLVLLRLCCSCPRRFCQLSSCPSARKLNENLNVTKDGLFVCQLHHIEVIQETINGLIVKSTTVVQIVRIKWYQHRSWIHLPVHAMWNSYFRCSAENLIHKNLMASDAQIQTRYQQINLKCFGYCQEHNVRLKKQLRRLQQ